MSTASISQKAQRRHRIRSWLRRHWLFSFCAVLLLGFVGLNLLAYSHAGGMLHFVPGGTRTRSPQLMTWTEKLHTLINGVTIPKPVNNQTPTNIGLPFTIHRFASSDGICLEAWHVSATTSRGLVLLVHGYAGCKAILLEEGKFFHELGFDVMWLDCRASGGSEGEWTTIGYLEALDVQSALKYARKTWKPPMVVVFGQSMGAAAALRSIGCLQCSVDGLIIEAPFDCLLHTVQHRFDAMKVPDLGLSRLLLFWGGVQTGIPGFDHKPAEYAASVHCPTLIMWGDHDQYVRSDEVNRVYDALAGPKSICVLSGVDHRSCLSAAPETWKQAVYEFFNSHLRR
jgi:alpha-beta hydrolase superfamily lysophospholipase